jgi:DNA-binding transcriptional LysR family regulator
VIRSLVESGAGVGILPSRVAKSSYDELIAVDEKIFFKDEISFIYRFDIEKNKSTQTIINEFKKLVI